jgi:hypothetical protein
MEGRAMHVTNERVELEAKILKYRRLAREVAVDPETAQRILALVTDLQQKLREIDE